MFVVKEKDDVKFDESGKYETTFKYGFYKTLINDDVFKNKIGHIEASITANEKGFDVKLERFLKKACGIYGDVVLDNKRKNPKEKTKFEFK